MPESNDRTAAAGTTSLPPAAPRSQGGEVIVFLVLAIVIWPFIAAAFVGGYGFAVWIWQVLFGP